MTQWWLFFLVVLFSLLLTGGLRRYALAKNIIDLPNARSSHKIPTPRGGGVAIVIAFVCSLIVLAFNEAEYSVLVALAGAGSLVALIGFMDDHGHIAARWRLLGHFIAAVWALGWLGGFPSPTVFGLSLELRWLGTAGAIFYLVWMLNLYNFMDGIDGIASIEAIFVCVGAALLSLVAGFEGLIVLPLLLAAAVAGFLYWNFPPARIFMGDAGSGFLGIVLGILSIHAAWSSPQLFWCWLILLGVFIVDATFTLFVRLIRGDKVYEAHRSHAYQYASREFSGHLPVTMAVALINVAWLLPIAMCVIVFKLNGAVALIIAYLPLVLLAVRYRAGALE